MVKKIYPIWTTKKQMTPIPVLPKHVNLKLCEFQLPESPYQLALGFVLLGRKRQELKKKL